MGDSVQSIPTQYVVAQANQPASPFEGQLWVDTDNGDLFRYLNGEWTKVGADVTYIQEFMNDVAATQERHDLELSINSWNYDDGFIDIIWDESKIASKNSVFITTGSSGKAQLVPGSSNTLEDQTNSVYSTIGDKHGLVFKPYLSGTYDIEVKYLSGWETNNSTGGIYTADDLQVERLDTGEEVASTTVDNPSAGGSATISDVPIEKGVEYAVYSNCNNPPENTLYDFPYKATSHDITGGYVKDDKTNGRYTNLFGLSIVGTATKGSVKHTRKKLGFTPSKLVANPEYDSSGSGESVEMVVSDNSGNSVTLTEQDFGSEFSVSFSDGNIQVKPNLYGDGSSSPEWNKTKLLGVQ